MIACTRPPIILYSVYAINTLFNTTYYKAEMKIVKCDESHTIHVVRIRNKVIYTNPPLPLFFNNMYYVWSIWRTRIEQWFDFGSKCFWHIGWGKTILVHLCMVCPYVRWNFIKRVPLRPLTPRAYLLTLKAPLFIGELWRFVSPHLIM